MTDKLKTPLNGIFCFIEISKSCKDIDLILRNLEIINKNAHILHYHINSFLDYGSILKNSLILKIE